MHTLKTTSLVARSLGIALVFGVAACYSPGHAAASPVTAQTQAVPVGESTSGLLLAKTPVVQRQASRINREESSSSGRIRGRGVKGLLKIGIFIGMAVLAIGGWVFSKLSGR